VEFKQINEIEKTTNEQIQWFVAQYSVKVIPVKEVVNEVKGVKTEEE